MPIRDESIVEAILIEMGEGVIVVDAGHAVVYANPAAGRLLACSHHELMGRPFAMPMPTTRVSEIELPTRAVLELRTSAVTWCEQPAFLILMREITEQRLQEGRLRRQAQATGHTQEGIQCGFVDSAMDHRDERRHTDAHLRRWKNVFDNIAIGVVVGAPDSERIELMNPAFAAMHGYTVEELLRQPYTAVITPESQAQIPAHVRAMYEKGHHSFESIHIRKDGTTLPLLVDGTVVRDEHGNNLYSVLSMQDTSRLKCIEQEVRDLNAQLEELLEREREARADAESQRRILQSVLNEAPAMMALHHGPELVYQYANKSYCQAIGRIEADIIGKPAREALPELAGHGIHEILEEVYRTGQAFRASELPLPIDVDRDGRPQDRYFTFVVQPVLDTCGQISGILVHAIDVTKSMLARQELQRKSEEVAELNRDLERRVAERTAQLELANAELEAFSYSVSHDLRSPLRRIDGYGQALLEDCGERLSEEERHYLERIRISTQYMGELIDDLLALSRVSRLDMQGSLVDLSVLASKILAELQEQEPARRVEVKVTPQLLTWADEKFVRIALENLLDNAWKFTSKTENAVIELGVTEVGGERAFYVRDNGAGFDPQYTQKLFGTFNRLHSPTEFSGTGIGLVTVRRVIERHGGRIWAEGAIERGAVFYFTLPMSKPMSDPAPGEYRMRRRMSRQRAQSAGGIR